ncbi:MAG TPA: antibiotic biosynthesis monooxygenase [Dissulfurispiraceae bacterium]|nr:antibiotic biosynthesis monooxygenase [Dissulfurispiraceae bacterium]
MIEVFVTYDLLPNVDQKSYIHLLKKAIVPILSQPGIVEIRARRSQSGSPEVLIVFVWETLSHWKAFEMKKEWATLKDEVNTSCASNLKIQVWGPSPIAPEPLRPLK